jgi:two-component system, NarL family, response regulator DevR
VSLRAADALSTARQSLFLGEGAVRNYVSSTLSKLGVSNRAEAAAYAVEHSLREHIQA